MSNSELGKKFIVEVADTYLSDTEKQQLAELQPAGIMFRSRNFLPAAKYEDWLQEFEFLVSDIREILGDQIILCIDHEGHKITRPPDPITRFPYASRWREDSAAVARAMATELGSLAINVIFAPCLDIHSNENNPVIAERAFGRTVDEVIKYSSLFIEELKQHPIIGCGKHYPGHGDTSEDSHYQYPILEAPLEELKNRELKPFDAAIKQGLPLIMTAHLIFPQIDANNIATFSKVFLQDILREELGFGGLIIADAFSMKPVLETIEHADTIKNACNSSLDLFSVVGPKTDLALALRLKEQLSSGLKNKSICTETFNNSISRIETFLAQLPVNTCNFLSADVFEAHIELATKLWKNESWANLELKSHMITK